MSVFIFIYRFMKWTIDLTMAGGDPSISSWLSRLPARCLLLKFICSQLPIPIIMTLHNLFSSIMFSWRDFFRSLKDFKINNNSNSSLLSHVHDFHFWEFSPFPTTSSLNLVRKSCWAILTSKWEEFYTPNRFLLLFLNLTSFVVFLWSLPLQCVGLIASHHAWILPLIP